MQYILDTTETYGEAYKGEYLLNRKREMYIREDENCIGSVVLSFNKLSVSNTTIK